ncbi:hypothetical protein SAMN02745194_03572 [Roseomonas rosea]|uniref:Phytanoyl-CoA dioxygenase (PhyH) n=1 Tax=Muricoccus roseus TaxID=198092 RepID=A0A1M6MT47_9PROT|nr:hypothetical protein [Roseomonas rosea]SHJ86549.1 hypothetical protein SAMN02745194_03572 [Roseomonas rosea]
MISYAQLQPGRGFEARRAALYYAQRLATPRRFRQLICRALAAAIRRRHGRCGAQGTPEARHAAKALDRDGLAMLEPLFAPPALQSIRAFLRHEPVVGPDGRPAWLEALPQGTRTAAYPLPRVLACPGLIEAINAPAILRIASDYLGCKPTLSSLGIRWSLPSEAQPLETQLFHRDPDDWRFLKLFVYLTDVDERTGPHVFVTGSHRTAATLRARPFSRAALERDYGADRIRMITGPGGTTFIADTHGIHMGMPPVRAPRLVLQVQYSLLPIFAFRYEPVALAARPRALDPYVNRLIAA